MITPAPRAVPTNLKLLRVMAVAASVGAVVQAILGPMIRGDGDSPVRQAHAGVATLTALLILATAFFAWRWVGQGGASALRGHAIGMVLLVAVQLGLGYGGVKVVHMILGVLVLAGMLALAVLAYVKPGGRAATRVAG